MENSEQLQDKIKHLIVDRLQLDGVKPEEIEAETPLFDEGLGLDSVDALELVLGLEQEFGLKIEAPEMGKDTLQTVRAIAEFVIGKLERARPAETSPS